MGEIGITETKPRSAARERVRRTGRCIGELLMELGVAPHTAGFCALRVGTVLLTERETEYRQRLIDTLYPIVERYAAQERLSAEHAIRDTVRISFSREPSALRTKLFPDGSAPTNAEILYALAAYTAVQVAEREHL